MKYFIFFLIFCLSWAELRDPFVSSSEPKNYQQSSGQEDLFIYNVLYRDPQKLAEIIKTLFPEVLTSPENDSKQLILKCNKTTFLRLYPHLQKLDQSCEQAMIEVKVVELSENAWTSLGLVWQSAQDTLQISQPLSQTSLLKRLDLLIGQGKASLLACPRVTSVLGKEAEIHIGDKVPFTEPSESNSGKIFWTVKYLDAGVNLHLLPQKAEPGYLVLKLKPEVASIKQWKQTPSGEFPILSARQVETNLKIKEGEVFIIGGLLDEQERENLEKVPVLGDIPLLNIFFRHTTKEKVKSDIVFIVSAKRV